MEYIVTSRWALTLPVHGHQQAPKPHSVVFAAANVCFQCRSVPDVLPGWEKSAALQWKGVREVAAQPPPLSVVPSAIAKWILKGALSSPAHVVVHDHAPVPIPTAPTPVPMPVPVPVHAGLGRRLGRNPAAQRSRWGLMG
eukprot:CAMPEP_0174318744 /NCGR_PEP_ID=MMETSP0810-20121108/8414_1 /TAXON_ID=73025 ORGANISM="Eutreptiella gymnastica-like, Strain CCMP1594" /NCGR_SAMPLE_ID=MMETSP0810 /ASSEMBLY_ACC=CAM_ASM_000659 /LENGTH=139 /DNA_ID=CAMNT_0015429079 /DNA_START=197 /DNA_END=617 /DNA_ORIENTATION=+